MQGDGYPSRGSGFQGELHRNGVPRLYRYSINFQAAGGETISRTCTARRVTPAYPAMLALHGTGDEGKIIDGSTAKKKRATRRVGRAGLRGDSPITRAWVTERV